MHAFLIQRLPAVFADLLTALWYALLIAAVFYCVFEPRAEFNYLNV